MMAVRSRHCVNHDASKVPRRVVNAGDAPVGLRTEAVGGGQFKQAIKQIVEAESIPIRTLEGRKLKEEAKLKLFQEFKARFQKLDQALSEASSFRQFRELKVDTGTGANQVSATLDANRADHGQYTIEVRRLATPASILTNGLPSADEPLLGLGFVHLGSLESDDAEVTSISLAIEDEQSSLSQIAQRINHAPDSPFQASVIRDDTNEETPYRLLITHQRTGEIHTMDAVEFSFGERNMNLWLEEEQEPQNAELLIDGFEIESATNDIEDFVTGVNLHLLQAAPDEPFTLQVVEDLEKISGKMRNLVDQINEILGFIEKQNTIDAQSDTSTTFAGDVSLQSIEYQLRNVLHESYPTTPASLQDLDEAEYAELSPGRSFLENEDHPGLSPPLRASQIGIEFDKSGKLQFDEAKFNAAMDTRYEEVARGITGERGMVQRLKSVFDNYTRIPSGTLSIKESGLRNRIRQIDQQVDQKTRAIEQRRQNLTEKFARLESSLGAMQKQQQHLSAALGSTANNPITQLLG